MTRGSEVGIFGLGGGGSDLALPNDAFFIAAGAKIGMLGNSLKCGLDSVQLSCLPRDTLWTLLPLGWENFLTLGAGGGKLG